MFRSLTHIFFALTLGFNCLSANEGIADLAQFDQASEQSVPTYAIDNFEQLISHEEIAQKIASVARALNEEYRDKELTLVMVLKGSVFLAADLMRQLEMPCTLEWVKASSYGKRGTKNGELSLFGIDELAIEGKNVLLIDDIFDTGNTLSRVSAELQKKNPKTLKSLVLLVKKVNRKTAYYPDYALFEIDNHFVIGYGLDYKEYYRNLSGIYNYRG